MVYRLKKDVWYVGRCCECGACISTCSKNILRSPRDGDHPELEVREKRIGSSHIVVDTCFFCEKPCEDSCPRLREWEKGQILHTVTVTSRLPDTSIVNALLIASIRRKLVDGAVTWDIDRETFKPIPKIVTREEEILTTSGYQYLWHPILEVLNDAIYKKGLKKIAVVGPPCIAQAVKAIRTSNNNKLKVYKNSIYLMIGVFCEGAYTQQLVQEIVDRFDINPYELNRLIMDIKNKVLRIVMQEGLMKGISLPEIRRYMKQGCARCTDFTAECADISVGTIGLEEKGTMVIVRTPLGERSLKYAFMEKTLKPSETSISLEEIQKLVIDKERRKRAQEIDSLTSLMLESLLGKKSRDEVREKLKIAWR
ncbi:MAG: Coenzyme F420 hydrogenase/dehydrogenase, beta subunit C-terminal domain [Nitrososphaerota archaeon]